MTLVPGPDITSLRGAPCPTDLRQLIEFLSSAGSLSPRTSFECLESAVQQTPRFFDDLLPFVVAEALRADELLREVELLAERGEVRLSQRQCLCILANAFLCRFTDRVSRHSISAPGMPSINFDELFGGHRSPSVRTAKLRMIFQYFAACRERIHRGDDLGRPVRFLRHQGERATAPEWRKSSIPLVAPVVHPLGESIDDARGMLRVDFANEIIGGGVLASGCVQEEIMFCLCPELSASRLFCPVMLDDEAIAFVGVEQFSKPRGYGRGLEYGGPHHDRTALGPDGILDSWIVAIDAVPFHGLDDEAQYSRQLVLRELRKAWAGFTIPDSPSNVATGNWGCGAFGGDPELKSVIQWAAACRAGKAMHYFPWDSERIHQGLPALASRLVERGVTVGELCDWLFDRLRGGGVFGQMQEYSWRGSDISNSR